MVTQPVVVTPGRGIAALAGQFWGLFRAELVMQWRRWGLWLAFGGAWGIILFIFVSRLDTSQAMTMQVKGVTLTMTPIEYVHYLTFATSLFTDLLFPMLAALLVADRLGRDVRLGMRELQRSAPQGPVQYVLGKFMGNYVALIVPTLLAFLLYGLLLIAQGRPVLLMSTLLEAFGLIFVPVFAAVIALTLLLSSFLPLRIVQIGFPLLWLLSTASPLQWYTINNTIFNPKGSYIFPVFFPTIYERVIPTTYTVQDAIINIGALLGVAAVSLALTVVSLKARERREEKGA